MDVMAAADTLRPIAVVANGHSEESSFFPSGAPKTSISARRRRLESRRANLPSSGSPLAEPLLKRSRNSPFLLRRNSEGSGSFTNTTSKQFQVSNGFQPGAGKSPPANSDGHHSASSHRKALRSRVKYRCTRAKGGLGRLKHALKEDGSSSGTGSESDDSDGSGVSDSDPQAADSGGLDNEVHSILHGLNGGEQHKDLLSQQSNALHRSGGGGGLQSAGGGSGPDMGGTASGGAGSTTSSGENRGSGESAGPVGAPGQPRGITAVPIPTGPSKCCSAGDHGKAAVDVCPPHGVLAVCGRRKEMEDAVATVPALLSVPCQGLLGCQTPPPAAAPDADPAAAAGDTAGGSTCQLHFFAVYDGHGGSQVANFCSERLHLALAEELQLSLAGAPPSDGDGEREPESEHTMESHWRAAFLAAFTSVDAHVAGKCPRAGPCRGRGGGQPCEVEHEPLAPETVGTTAIVTVVSASQIIVGNAGDSRAVLSRGGAAVALSSDHKPEREDEMKRVEAAGGRVIFWNGYRILGVLAMSRAIGDRYLKPYVIAEPEVTFTRRSPDDECMILASDGLWDVISSQEACEFVLKVFQQKSAESQQEQAAGADAGAAPAGGSPSSVAASALTKLALTRGSGDNISVVVVDLRPPAAAAAAAAAEAE